MKCQLLRTRGHVKALFFLSQVLWAISTNAQNNQSTIRGTIRGENNQPLANVSVGVHNPHAKFTAGTKTDSLGVYEVRVPAGSSYVLTFTSVGYEPQTLSGYS